MDEAVVAFMKEMFTRYGTEYKNFDMTKGANEREDIELALNEIQYAEVTKSGHVFKLKDFDQARTYLTQARKARKFEKVFDENRWNGLLKQTSEVIRDLISDVGEYGCNELSRQLWSFIYSNYSVDNKYDVNIARVKSGCVSGLQTPTLSCYDVRTNKVRVNNSDLRLNQRIISARGYYNNPALRQDSILVEAEERRRSSKITLWIGKVLALIRIPLQRSLKLGSNSNINEEKSFAFIQYYDFIPPADQIDKVLNCIKLRWAAKPTTTEGDDDIQFSNNSKWFGLIDIRCVRGVVHVVRGDYGVDGRGIYKDINAVPWNEEFFYVNRFYHEGGNKYFKINSAE